MSFCRVSDKYAAGGDVISLEKVFLDEYLPSAPPEYVKVYLFGLHLCFADKPVHGYTDMAEELHLDTATVAKAFHYWEDLGLVESDGEELIFHGVSELLSLQKPKEMTAYAAFNRALQKLFPNRILQPKDFILAHDWLEVLHLPEEVALLLVRYALDNCKKKDISVPYIDRIAQEWADNGITSLATAEDYMQSHGKTANKAVLQLLDDLGLHRDATRAEVQMYKKWQTEWGFDEKAIRRAAASTVSVRNPAFTHVDAVLERLRSGKDNKFDIELLRALGIGRNLTTAAEQELIAKWRGFGCSDEMILLATRKTLTLQNPTVAHVDKILVHWHEKGITDPAAAEVLWNEEVAAKHAARSARPASTKRGLDYAQRSLTEEQVKATVTDINDL